MATISKTIPSRVEKFEIGWCISFHTWGFIREAKAKVKLRIPKQCWWCKGIPDDDDDAFLISVKGKTNKLICAGCEPHIRAAIDGAGAASSTDADQEGE